jgi:peptidoglycan/xylan/chitin deacetylase (PgdA/CDA1 family)
MPAPDPFSRRRFVLAGLVAAALGACRSSSSSRERSGGSSTTTLGTGDAGRAPSTAGPTGAPSTPAPGTLPPTSSAASAGPARYVAHGDRSLSKVALTFHASGDPTLAQQLLDVVARAGVPITVFGVGQWMAQHPDLVSRIARDGHELANHTLTHQAMGRLPEDQIDREVTGCAEVLRSLTGSITAWFRPSGIEVPTDTILAHAGRAGYPVSVGYDVDSRDFQEPGAGAVQANVLDHVQPGSIVSLHFGHQGTIAAFGPIVDGLRARQLEPVTVSGLLA